MSIGVYLLEYNRIYSFVGIFVILAIACLFSHNRKNISYKLVFSGLLLHFLLALAVLKTTVGKQGIEYVAGLVAKLYEAADQGIEFIFGKLSVPSEAWGFIFAIKVLPVIIFFGAFMSLLFYLGIVQRLVSAITFLLRPLLGTSGAETLCAAANSFLGQTEAPLLVRGYLKNMTKSEFMVVMVSGMGSISGAILAVFARMGVPATHLLAASVMSIPATIVIAKILYPEVEKPQTADGAQTTFESPATNVLDAISMGTSDGLQLALNVGAMLIAFIALIGMFNGLLSFTCFKINELFSLNMPLITLDTVFSWIGLPFGWLLGFTGKEAVQAGELIGTKVAVNELVAYSKMVAMDLPDRTKDIITYALCGFSNFSCIGIQIGGIGALVPEKRQWLSELGLRAVLGGALANLLSAMVASLLL